MWDMESACQYKEENTTIWDQVLEDAAPNLIQMQKKNIYIYKDCAKQLLLVGHKEHFLTTVKWGKLVQLRDSAQHFYFIIIFCVCK